VIQTTKEIILNARIAHYLLSGNELFDYENNRYGISDEFWINEYNFFL